MSTFEAIARTLPVGSMTSAERRACSGYAQCREATNHATKQARCIRRWRGHRIERGLLEGDLNPAYISALSALAGALIDRLTSFATSLLTQRTQILNAHREAEKAKLEALYSDFIAEAARMFGDALTHQTDDANALVQLYSMVGRMRLISDRTGVDAAVRVEEALRGSSHRGLSRAKPHPSRGVGIFP